MWAKQCNKCKELLPAIAFSGRRSTCKKCYAPFNAAATQKHKEKYFPVPYNIVYMIKDEYNDIIYIGETTNGPKRLAEHFGWDNSKSFHKGQFKREYCLEFWTYEFIETYSKEERLIKEIELEFKYEPRYNSRWKTN